MNTIKCRSKNPATCRYHGTTKPLALPPIPDRYQVLPERMNLGEENFDDLAYIKKSAEFINGLSPEQTQVLNDYVQAGYQDINETLYSGAIVSAEVQQKIDVLDSVLAGAGEAPPVLWRNLSGHTLPASFMAKGYKPGDEVVFEGFTSTSETPSALTGVLSDTSIYMETVPPDEWEHDPVLSYKVVPPASFLNQPSSNVVFMIRASTAAPVSALRGTVVEQEWLLPRGKKFRVADIHHDRTLTGGQMREPVRANIFVLEEI